MRIVLLGPPGAGKSTQAERIVNKIAVLHLSTGDMLRSAVREQSEIGKQAKDIMARGELVPDDLVVAAVEERMSRPDAADGFVLDGFPRTISQAQSFDAYLSANKLHLDHVVELQVNEEMLLGRVEARAREAREQGRPARAEDNRDALKIRLDSHYQKTVPLIDFYRSRKALRSVNGLQSMDAVTRDIFAALR